MNSVPPRVRDGADGITDGFERLDVLGVTAERELDLGLLDDGVDAAHAIGFGVRHPVERLQRRLEVGERFLFAAHCAGEQAEQVIDRHR